MAKTRFVYDGKKHLEAEFGGFIPYFCGCRFRKLHPPEWRLFPNQNMIPFDDRNRLPFRPHGVRLLQVATAA